MNVDFEQKIALLQQQHEALLQRSNLPVEETNGIVCRYTYPIVTREHIPLEWRYDFNPATNPYCMERIGFNATMNSGAIKWNGKYVLVVRVEGADRKSFFAVAESPNGIDNFRFWKRPITLPDINPAETNVYDMRLTPMKTAGYMEYFAVNAMTTVHRPATFRQQWQRQVLSVPRIWWNGNVCRT